MAELDVRERHVGDVTILDLSGRVTFGEGNLVLREAIRRLMQEGHKKILLNFGQVDYVDSSGLGEVIANYTTISKEGGHLKLLNLTDRLQGLLVITKLLTVFESFESEDKAVKSFK
jgi:anti-sigma B factor antagonist